MFKNTLQFLEVFRVQFLRNRNHLQYIFRQFLCKNYHMGVLLLYEKIVNKVTEYAPKNAQPIMESMYFLAIHGIFWNFE